MKTHLKSFGLLGALLLGLTTASLPAQVLVVTAGAVSTNAGAKLKFVNGTNYTVGSGFSQALTYQRFANRYGTNYYYGTSNLLFQALSVKTNSDISAAFGSYIVCQIMSVTGPAGGVLTFWEQGAKFPTYDFPVNGAFVTGKNRFILSNLENGAGSPGGDPFGNIRGRRFTVNKLGDYLVTFKLYDASLNNLAFDGPIHTPSDPLTIKFSAGVDIGATSLVTSNDVAVLTFKQGGLTNLYVEAAPTIAGTWTTIGGPFTNISSSNLVTMTFTNTPGLPTVFYRLRGIAP